MRFSRCSSSRRMSTPRSAICRGRWRPAPAETAYEAARTLMQAERFAEALAALGTSDDDHRIDYLRGVLLAGIPGQPRSAALIDLRAAEDAFVSATHKASFRHAAETAQCFIGAAKAAARRWPARGRRAVFPDGARACAVLRGGAVRTGAARPASEEPGRGADQPRQGGRSALELRAARCDRSAVPAAPRHGVRRPEVGGAPDRARDRA